MTGSASATSSLEAQNPIKEYFFGSAERYLKLIGCGQVRREVHIKSFSEL